MSIPSQKLGHQCANFAVQPEISIESDRLLQGNFVNLPLNFKADIIEQKRRFLKYLH